MRIHYIQHEPFEDLGCIREWMLEKKHTITSTHIWEQISFPPADAIDLLIIMGGSMSAFDDDKYDWLSAEKAFIKSCIDQKKKVLGICLGSQLIAGVCGAEVYPGSSQEIGWYAVKLTDEALQHPLMQGIPAEFVTMHWHGDTYTLPQGAIRIGSSELTENQGFILNDTTVGLQFHPELTVTAIQKMFDGVGNISSGPYVMPTHEIEAGFYHCHTNNSYVFGILDHLSAS